MKPSKMINGRLGRFAALCIAATAVSTPLLGQKPALSMLGELEPGSWQLRVRGDQAPARVCLGDPKRLIQLRHPTAPSCERLIVVDSDDEVTVQYTCKGQGYGRTQIRRETPRLIQIESQGIAQGRPFSFSGEARRTGPC